MLLTRDQFRTAIFARDKHVCVVPECSATAKDAHHIMERRLFDDGGYYVDNGASLCEVHHIEAERTVLTTEALRAWCKIQTIVLPSHLYADETYDKWGNIYLGNDQWLRGELFNDLSVQKILHDKLHSFTRYVKYPRTYHVPWSGNMNDDDRMLPDMSSFIGRKVLVTEKMDGENTTMYCDHIHARSVNSSGHPTRDWVKNKWATIRYEIPEGWRICGENMYGTHSIKYEDLPSYFLGFSIWNERNECLSTDNTFEWFDLLGIVSVPPLFNGLYDEDRIRALWTPDKAEQHEGYVIRVADAFTYRDFRSSVAKFVRPNHIQTTKHWMSGQRIEKNVTSKEGIK